MEDCIFCKIANGTITTKLLHDDESVIAFHDIDPQAPHHVLIIPRKHIATLNDCTKSDFELIGHMSEVAKQLAQSLEIAESGYRILMNCNREGGQAVYHIHMHLMGGRSMRWPPG